jgi:D-3-phosphoglycerate dehydrogenase
VIGRAGVGVDTIDVDAATEKGIAVLTAPSGNTISACELTFALLLALVRRVPAADRSMHDGAWDRKSFGGVELYGKTLGLVGFGRIGKWVARLAKAYGMTVLAADPYVKDAEGLAEMVPLEELLRRSDFVSLHPVLTPETHHMIGAEQLALMKNTAYLVNTSRGGVVDEAALTRALREGRIAGAGLDVFETEPPDPENPLLAMPNVIATPHALPRTAESLRRCAEMTQESVIDLLDGRLPRYTVNRGVHWRMSGRASGAS